MSPAFAPMPTERSERDRELDAGPHVIARASRSRLRGPEAAPTPMSDVRQVASARHRKNGAPCSLIGAADEDHGRRHQRHRLPAEEEVSGVAGDEHEELHEHEQSVRQPRRSPGHGPTRSRYRAANDQRGGTETPSNAEKQTREPIDPDAGVERAVKAFPATLTGRERPTGRRPRGGCSSSPGARSPPRRPPASATNSRHRPLRRRGGAQPRRLTGRRAPLASTAAPRAGRVTKRPASPPEASKTRSSDAL